MHSKQIIGNLNWIGIDIERVLSMFGRSKQLYSHCMCNVMSLVSPGFIFTLSDSHDIYVTYMLLCTQTNN